jgi:hypothetical protein
MVELYSSVAKDRSLKLCYGFRTALFIVYERFHLAILIKHRDSTRAQQIKLVY